MIPNTFESEKFEKLMSWLGPDRESAGSKYESIRVRLVKIFYARGCHQAEEMADETMDRVTKKIDNLLDIYEGDPALYFYAVAKNVLLEFSRSQRFTELSENLSDTPADEGDQEDDSFECLEKCLRELTETQRGFILEYYTGDKRDKIDRRKNLSESLGISDKALRIRAYRIRDVLRKCISLCLENGQPA
jgi:DNA-directed RNA polymerase specialized sigma24 family protein